MSKILFVKCVLSMVALTACLSLQAMPILQTSDFIADIDRTNFVSFDGLQLGASNSPSYTEDNVVVTQMLGEGDEIWSTCSSSCFTSPDGKAWYPDGGDFGYTVLTRGDGSEFVNVGLIYGGKTFVAGIYYELLKDGVSVLSGGFEKTTVDDGYIGFQGGGFDTLRLIGPTSDSFSGFNEFGDGTNQALPIDSIELSGLRRESTVPNPATLALFGLGLAGLGWSRRRKA